MQRVRVVSWVAKRRIARLYMVQSAYSLMVNELDGGEEEELLQMFSLCDQNLGEWDQEFFSKLLKTFKSEYEENDEIIKSHLLDSWAFERFDWVLLSLIRVALCEMKNSEKSTYRMVVDEYVTMASSFLKPAQVNFVNAILDKIIREMGA